MKLEMNTGKVTEAFAILVQLITILLVILRTYSKKLLTF